MVQLPTGPTLSCPFGASPVAVIATYAGGLLPVEGATVTLFYSTLASFIGAPMTTTRTNVVGLGEACFTTGYFVQARIQKTGVNFGSGSGVQHIIGTKSGWDRFFNPTFLIIARSLPPIIVPPPPPPLPCLGSIGITPPNFTQLLSGPAMPTSIPVPFTIVKDWGATIPPSIPLSIIIDDKVVSKITAVPGQNNIDILPLIKSLGTTALNSAHRLSIRPDLPNCSIPAQGFDIPALVLPCSGSISIKQLDFTQLLSGPALPPSISAPVSITGTGLQQYIPLLIFVDGTQVAKATGVANGSVNIDVLSAIRALGASAFNIGHTLDVKSSLPNCTIFPASLFVPRLVPTGIIQVCTEGQTQTLPCLDGSNIVIAVCKRDPVTGINAFIPTGNTCPPPEIKQVCQIGEQQSVTCPDGAVIVVANCQADPVSGLNRWVPTGKTCAAPPIKQVCQIGEQQSVTCPDGAVVVTANCESDPATGINRWVPTGKSCPPPPLKQVCQIGDVRKISCPGGTEIVTQKCEADPITGINRWAPTGNTCPPPEMGKIIKILTYPAGAALEAFDGMDVTITASVVCGASPSSGEIAIFSVDGNEISRGTTSSGFVTFSWKATVEPSRTHKICVYVPKSSQCSQYGEARDCKTITVSRAVPEILEKLKKERESYLSQLEAQRIEREKIRQISLTLPLQPYMPVVTVPTLPEVTAPPTPPSIPVPPPAEQVPGIIDIPTVSMPPGVLYPIEILIDGGYLGPAPVYKEVTPGTHTVTIRLKGFTPISKKVNVSPGQILTIEEGFT